MEWILQELNSLGKLVNMEFANCVFFRTREAMASLPSLPSFSNALGFRLQLDNLREESTMFLEHFAIQTKLTYSTRQLYYGHYHFYQHAFLTKCK